MRRIPWRLAVRFSRKGAITVLGIALGISFALVSYSVATGLERDTIGIAKNHPSDAALVTAADGGPVPWSDLSSYEGMLGVVQDTATDRAGIDVPVIAILGTADDPATGTAVPHGEVRFPLLLHGREVLPAPGEPGALVARGWSRVAVEDVARQGDLVDHGYLAHPTKAQLDALGQAGFRVERAPALQDFFTASGAEVARDLLLIVAFSGALAMLFCYEFLRSEVRESRREIGIWRALGMRAQDVVALFLARSLALGVAALWIGWALAAIVMGVALDRVGTELLRFDISIVDGLLLSLAFLAATLLGGLIPSIVASRITVQRSLESA